MNGIKRNGQFRLHGSNSSSRGGRFGGALVVRHGVNIVM
jgi:hypothetical protein